jgi:purine-nucleoside phosphorylase
MSAVVDEQKAIDQLAETVRTRTGLPEFELAVILGSGLGALVAEVEAAFSFFYRDYSCFPTATAAGHAGLLTAGLFQGRPTLLFSGRFHLYEGYSARQVAIPVRIARELGCRRLLLTNAAGGINDRYRAGDFMYITDHLNLLGDNPLRGVAGDPFLDLCHLYHPEFFQPLRKFAQQNGIHLHQGVLAALPGPSYETPAEIRALRHLGADAVSMSTVPEAIQGKFLGMEIVGLSFIANLAAGLSNAPLRHQDVLDQGNRAADHFRLLVRQLVSLWPGEIHPRR